VADPAIVPATCVPWFWVSHSLAAMPSAHSLAVEKLTAITLRCARSTAVPPHTLIGGRPSAASRK
jgi:hypothetical protein